MHYLKYFENFEYEYHNDSVIEFDIPLYLVVEKVLNAISYYYNSIDYLDEGNNGVVILVDDKIMKISIDDKELTLSNKIKKLETNYLVDIDKVVTITSDFHYGKYNIIIQEKLNTNLDSKVKVLFDSLNKRNNVVSHLDNGFYNKEFIFNSLKESFVNITEGDFFIVFEKWYNIYKECREYNIPIDDLRSRNVGYDKKGTLKFFDITSLYTPISIDLLNIPNIKI